MRIERHTDVRTFFDRVEPFLTRNEAENNLQLGFREPLERDPFIWGPEAPVLLAVVDGDEVVAVATRTPPYPLVLSFVHDLRAVGVLADELRGEALPGLTAPVRAGEAFLERWPAAATLEVAQRAYQATEVIPPPPPGGAARTFTPEDSGLVAAWIDAFSAEAVPGQVGGSGETWLARREGLPGGLLLWEDGGQPVSFLAYGSPTPNGMRIGPVYTPPERRGRGYASALTAAATEHILASGKRFCFLFTDLANPTSNSIYQQVGYRPVTDVNLWRFAAA